LTYGEWLDEDGDVTQDHVAYPASTEVERSVTFQVDQVTSAGIGGDVFEPRHSTKGFQYVRVDGYDGTLRVDDITAMVVHTDLRRIGGFECSDERINKLHDIADWSFRDNACDIPTDCPHRERQGWTGEWQIFLPSAAFLYDVAGFSVKWLRSLADEQLPDGLLPNYVPDPRRWKAVENDDLSWFGLLGSAGWGDASVLVPWELYRLYGDRGILDEMWPTMKRWLGYAAHSARTKRHATRTAARPTALPHEAFLWDGGWHWGEWCEPIADSAEPWYAADQGHVATAYLHRSASIAAEVARLLGHANDADTFDVLAARALDAWRREYLAADGSLTPDTQANHVRALAFGLVPDQLRRACAARLVQLVRNAGTHLNTGFLATPMLLPVLADHGHLDVAYELLMQDTEPSWLTMVDRGASTVWEAWHGIDEHGVAHESLNHYSKGAVISFLHRYVAGIRPDPDDVAYRRFRIEPLPGGGLTSAEAVHDSPYGRIESSWRVDANVEPPTFELTTTVPPGTTADVRLPDGTQVDVGPGVTLHHCTLG
ncbi:MAG: family 78 glycoside hydrolase catalytic domain, partial [Ilumatobacteraceae bacterium]